LLKQFSDGVFTTHTALMLEDYSDAPGNKGLKLNGYEKAIKKYGTNGTRHAIEHVELTSGG